MIVERENATQVLVDLAPRLPSLSLSVLGPRVPMVNYIDRVPPRFLKEEKYLYKRSTCKK